MKYTRIFTLSTTSIFSIATTAIIRRNIVFISSSIATTNTAGNLSSFVDISSSGQITTRRQSQTQQKYPNSVLFGNTGSRNLSNDMSEQQQLQIDPLYPGTAVERMMNVRRRVADLVLQTQTNHSVLNGSWNDVRKKLLWAGGLRDLPNARPGQGYTGHSFNDFNHVDLTCMRDATTDNTNDGSVPGIAIGNQLGDGIRIASISELGPGGSWSTCAMGCARDPPQDVAHIQFRSRIAFKLVWVPNERYDTFVLVDDDGKLLAQGTPSDGLPSIREREMNYKIVAGSKYAKAADKLVRNVAAE